MSKKAIPTKKTVPPKKATSLKTRGKTVSKKTVTKKVQSKQKPKVLNNSPKKQNHKVKLFENKKFRFEQKIAKSFLRPGMIVSFKYKGINVHDANPLVLVLNQKYMGKLHGINLNYCNYGQIIKIAQVVNQKINAKAIKLGQKYKISSPRGFYHVHLKPVLRMFKKSIYRTYFSSGVTATMLMDYKFEAPKGKNALVFNSKDGEIQTKVYKAQTKNIKRPAKLKPQNIKRVVSLSDQQKQRVVPDRFVQNSKEVPNKVKQVKQVSSNRVKVVKDVTK